MQGEFGEISEREEFLSGGETSAYMGRDGLANRLSTSAEGRPAYPQSLDWHTSAPFQLNRLSQAQAFSKIYTDHASINLDARFTSTTWGLSCMVSTAENPWNVVDIAFFQVRLVSRPLGV
jgi:hypothetical protein